jgi:hypothetical protein
MGPMRVATAMMVVVGWTVLHGVEPQVTCFYGPDCRIGFANATSFVQNLQLASLGDQLCGPAAPNPPSGSGCWELRVQDTAVAICAPYTGANSYCLSRNDVGNKLDVVLAQCNTLDNTIKGSYVVSPEVNLYFITCQEHNDPYECVCANRWS